MVRVRVRLLSEDAKLPSYAHEEDAGMDIFSCENYIIRPGERAVVSTGIAMEIPKGYAALVWDKSGLAARAGITVFGGVIDSGYRGEYKIILYNSGETSFEIRKGDKVAQILIQRVEKAEVEVSDSLSDSSRGDGGFGSTGGNSGLDEKVF